MEDKINKLIEQYQNSIDKLNIDLRKCKAFAMWDNATSIEIQIYNAEGFVKALKSLLQ